MKIKKATVLQSSFSTRDGRHHAPSVRWKNMEKDERKKLEKKKTQKEVQRKKPADVAESDSKQEVTVVRHLGLKYRNDDKNEIRIINKKKNTRCSIRPRPTTDVIDDNNSREAAAGRTVRTRTQGDVREKPLCDHSSSTVPMKSGASGRKEGKKNKKSRMRLNPADDNTGGGGTFLHDGSPKRCAKNKKVKTADDNNRIYLKDEEVYRQRTIDELNALIHGYVEKGLPGAVGDLIRQKWNRREQRRRNRLHERMSAKVRELL